MAINLRKLESKIAGDFQNMPDPKESLISEKDVSAPYKLSANKIEKEEIRPKSIVIGASLSGLSSAFSLSLVGHDVLVIDNRADYTREQLISIPNDLIQQFYHLSSLKKMGIKLHFFSPDQIPLDSDKEFEIVYPELFVEPNPLHLDLQFFRLLEKKFGIIPIRDLQTYLREKMAACIKEQTFSYPMEEECLSVRSHIPLYYEDPDWFDELISASSPIPLSIQTSILKNLGILNPSVSSKEFTLKGKVDFCLGPQYQVLAVDGDNQILTLQKEGGIDCIPFSNLVTADGSHHPTMNLLAKNPKYRFSQRDLESPRHNAYGLAQLQFTREDMKSKSEKREIRDLKKTIITTYLKDAFQFNNEEHSKLLSECGWKEHYFPFIFLVLEPEKNSATLTGEIPFDLLSQDNEHPSMSTEKEAKRIKWFQTIFKCLTNCDQLSLESAKSSSFKVQTRAFNKNHYRLGQGGHVLLVGDCFLPANFLYGHGAKAAIEDGNVLFFCFEDSEEFDPAPLDKQAVDRFDEYRFYRDSLESMRRFRFGSNPVCTLSCISPILSEGSNSQETKQLADVSEDDWDEWADEICPYDCKCELCSQENLSSIICCNQNLRSQSYMEALIEELMEASLAISAKELTMARELGWMRNLPKRKNPAEQGMGLAHSAEVIDSSDNRFALILYKGRK